MIACGAVECLVLERSNFQALLTDVHDDLVTVITRRDNNGDDKDSSKDKLTRYCLILRYLYADTKQSEVVVSGPLTNYRFSDLQHVRTVRSCSMKDSVFYSLTINKHRLGLEHSAELSWFSYIRQNPIILLLFML